MSPFEPEVNPSTNQRTSDMATALYDLHIEVLEQPTRQATVNLLQPLVNPNVLAACRDPSSRIVHGQEDNNDQETVPQESLNIQELGRAWRQALLKIPPIEHLIFNLIIPKRSRDAVPKIWWDVSMPSFARERDVGVRGQDVATIVMTIATTTKMRIQGNVKFDLVYDEDEGIPMQVVSFMRKQLDGLVKMRTLGEKGE